MKEKDLEQKKVQMETKLEKMKKWLADQKEMVIKLDKIKKMALAYQKEIRTKLQELKDIKTQLKNEKKQGRWAQKLIQIDIEKMKKMGLLNQDQDIDMEEMQATLKEEETGHYMPRSVGTEKAILNIIFFHNELIDKLAAIPKFEKVFFGEKNRIIYERMCFLRKKNMPINLVTLKDQLNIPYPLLTREAQAENYLKKIFISSLADRTSSGYTPDNLDACIRIVKDKALLRYIIWINKEMRTVAEKENWGDDEWQNWKKILSLGRTFQRITKDKREEVKLEKLRKNHGVK